MMRSIILAFALLALAITPAIACDGKDSNFASCDGTTILDVLQAPSGDAGAPTGDGEGSGSGAGAGAGK